MLHSRETVLHAVRHALAEPSASLLASNQVEPTAEDRLATLIMNAQREGIGQGMRAVQQEIIRALDVRHLLGLH